MSFILTCCSFLGCSVMGGGGSVSNESTEFQAVIAGSCVEQCRAHAPQ